MPQSKSVRIALERLDRMMNAVGELVINRTRMLGRLAELEKLAEVLNFSKGRMSDKVIEFQDKYEFSRISSVPRSRSMAGAAHGHAGARRLGERLRTRRIAAARRASPGSVPRRLSRATAHSFDASLAEFSELEMDRYDDFGILSRSLTEISADITEVLTQLDGFVRRVDGDIDEFTKLAHRLQDEITQARMVPIGNLYTRIARTVRDAAKASNKQVELTLAGAETELDNNIIQQIADPCCTWFATPWRTASSGRTSATRRASPTRATSRCAPTIAGNHIYVEVEDDGRGVDFRASQGHAAVERGFISAEEAAQTGPPRAAGPALPSGLFHCAAPHRTGRAAAWGWTWCAPTWPISTAKSKSRRRKESAPASP